MAESQGELDALIARRNKDASARAIAKALAERQSLGPPALREAIEDAWNPIRDRLVDAVSEWSEALKPTGLTVIWESKPASAGIIASQAVSVVDTFRANTNIYPLQISVNASPDSIVSFSGPQGNVINGDQGFVKLFTEDAYETIWQAIVRHVKRMG